MNDTDRKFLTEKLLGECWHGINKSGYCSECGHHSCIVDNRTFTTPDDFFTVKRKLVEKGEWDRFESMAETVWFGDPDSKRETLTNWLLDESRFCQSRFCQLAVDYLRREK